MEFQKTIKSLEINLNDKKSSKFVTKTKVYDHSEKYSINEEIRIKAPFVLSIKHNTIV